MKELERQFPSEFDYRTEAENLSLVQANLSRAGLCGSGSGCVCVIPTPYKELCTKRVLVMEELAGEKLVDVLKRDAERWSKLASIWNIEQDGMEHAPATKEKIATLLSSLDTSRRLNNGWNQIYNWTYGNWFGSRREYQSKADLPLNPAQLVDDLLHVHGHQVLVDGRFNADCHPGTYN
jgi:aarF domain-containing kinase